MIRLGLSLGVLVFSLLCINAAGGQPRGTATAGKIAFERGGAIYVMSADASGLRRLTPRSWSNPAREPVWSPDGKKIVFIRGGPEPVDEGDGYDELFVVDVDGSHLLRLTRDRFQDFSPTWSPNSRVIAFASYRSSAEIFAINADRTRLRQLTTTAGFDRDPAWSPSESILFIFSSDPEGSDVWVMNPDGSGRQQLTQADRAADELAIWSPNSKKIAFVRTPAFDDPALPKDAIYVMNADGSDQRRLTQIDANFPAWSPSGRWIAFLSYGRRGYDMYRISVDGGGLRLLARDTSEPSWSPDGKKIVFDRFEDIWVMNANGTGQKRLTRFRGPDYIPAYDPVWQPVPR